VAAVVRGKATMTDNNGMSYCDGLSSPRRTMRRALRWNLRLLASEHIPPHQYSVNLRTFLLGHDRSRRRLHPSRRATRVFRNPAWVTPLTGTCPPPPFLPRHHPPLLAPLGSCVRWASPILPLSLALNYVRSLLPYPLPRFPLSTSTIILPLPSQFIGRKRTVEECFLPAEANS